MAKLSSGLLMYRIKQGKIELFLVHPGGPFWKNKDRGAWSIPKGGVDEDEDLLKAARREFEEEIGLIPPSRKKDYLDLGEVKQKSGKVVRAWAFEGDWSGVLNCQSLVEIEWPPKSGKRIKIPEVGQAIFFEIREAKEKINPAQVEFICRLEQILANSPE